MLPRRHAFRLSDATTDLDPSGSASQLGEPSSSAAEPFVGDEPGDGEREGWSSPSVPAGVPVVASTGVCAPGVHVEVGAWLVGAASGPERGLVDGERADLVQRLGFRRRGRLVARACVERAGLGLANLPSVAGCLGAELVKHERQQPFDLFGPGPASQCRLFGPGRIAVSPCRGVKLPKTRAEERRFLSVDELVQLADAIDLEYRPVIWLAGVVGLRLSEIAGLRVGRIDFLRRRILITATVSEAEGQLHEDQDVKSRASRSSVSVPRFVIDELNAHLRRVGHTDPEQYVVTSPEGGPLRASASRRRVRVRAVKQAGLGELTLHELRHTAEGLLIAEGAHAKVIQARLGLASIRTTMDVYGHVLDDVDQGAADLLDDAFRGPFAAHEAKAVGNDEGPVTKTGPELGFSWWR